MHSQLWRDQARFVAMRGTGPWINRRDLLAATGLGGLAPATAGGDETGVSSIYRAGDETGVSSIYRAWKMN
jgi:hypothetical protein